MLASSSIGSGRYLEPIFSQSLRSLWDSACISRFSFDADDRLILVTVLIFVDFFLTTRNGPPTNAKRQEIPAAERELRIMPFSATLGIIFKLIVRVGHITKTGETTWFLTHAMNELYQQLVQVAIKFKTRISPSFRSLSGGPMASDAAPDRCLRLMSQSSKSAHYRLALRSEVVIWRGDRATLLGCNGRLDRSGLEISSSCPGLLKSLIGWIELTAMAPADDNGLKNAQHRDALLELKASVAKEPGWKIHIIHEMVMVDERNAFASSWAWEAERSINHCYDLEDGSAIVCAVSGECCIGTSTITCSCSSSYFRRTAMLIPKTIFKKAVSFLDHSQTSQPVRFYQAWCLIDMWKQGSKRGHSSDCPPSRLQVNAHLQTSNTLLERVKLPRTVEHNARPSKRRCLPPQHSSAIGNLRPFFELKEQNWRSGSGSHELTMHHRFPANSKHPIRYLFGNRHSIGPQWIVLRASYLGKIESEHRRPARVELKSAWARSEAEFGTIHLIVCLPVVVVVTDVTGGYSVSVVVVFVVKVSVSSGSGTLEVANGTFRTEQTILAHQKCGTCVIFAPKVRLHNRLKLDIDLLVEHEGWVLLLGFCAGVFSVIAQNRLWPGMCDCHSPGETTRLEAVMALEANFTCDAITVVALRLAIDGIRFTCRAIGIVLMALANLLALAISRNRFKHCAIDLIDLELTRLIQLVLEHPAAVLPASLEVSLGLYW
ncbi:uncharacterized protein MYCFIDRAFT_180470 [Pseudocercospora fijiensis CIRAD86]|uniref:Uncharacterized protein n=1 Tax=Pseudocercospora fijiensis (strain CIRAD86) TaxID=383855 RepID=M2YGP9_PSEFD|nr:uncharacterized protein MYCFIDRAFT_180470 [Pseudocercospora fijiensis CIRAD86]EME76985.1 hypothetical protein MYCFIDRAFT_180470 [Pseudocercospora fijiensis CIRAD86]